MNAKKKQPVKRRQSNSIECKKAEITARKITAYPPEQNRVLKKVVFQYKLQISAKAEIIEELIPKKALIDPESLLNVGDKIMGRTLRCMSTGAIRPEITHISSKHKGSRAVAGNYVYCRVFTPLY